MHNGATWPEEEFIKLLKRLYCNVLYCTVVHVQWYNVAGRGDYKGTKMFLLYSTVL